MTTAEFHILLALSAEIRHGLGIAQSVDGTTDGDIRLGPGTLYRSLKHLVDAGWIAEAEAPSGQEDPRRRFYSITGEGRERLSEEAHKFAKWVQVARDNDVLPDPI